MSIKIPDNLKKYGDVLTRGIIGEMAPEMAKGVLVEMLKREKIGTQRAIDWVENNATLWDMLGSDYQNSLRGVLGKIGSIDWLTSEWVISAIRRDFPAVASLFIGWKKAGNWLEHQVEKIKKEASK